MTTMNVSLTAELKSFVDSQVNERGFSTSSEYIRALIRIERDREKLRALLLEGANSPVGPPADAASFEALRARIRQKAKN